MSYISFSRVLPLSLALALAVPVALPSLAAAADKAVDTTTSTMLAKKDIEFLKAANQSGMLEIKEAELAVKRNLSGTNLNFAKKMVTDHEKVNQELTDLAAKKGVVLPTALDEDMQKKYDSLAKTEDTKLAKEYLECQVKAHKKAVSDFKEAAEDSKDADVKAFATKHLPHLQAHLDEVKRLEDAN